jgi:hypothetical protein
VKWERGKVEVGRYECVWRDLQDVRRKRGVIKQTRNELIERLERNRRESERDIGL